MGKHASAVEVIGLPRLRRTIKEAGGDLGELKQLNRDAAQAVLPTARASTPIGPGQRGHLVSTLRVSASASAGTIKAGTGHTGRFPYAGVVHYGTPDGKRADPWLLNAAHATEGKWTDVYLRGIESIIDNIEGA